MKNVLITAYNTFISRNLFNTEVLKLLKEDTDLKITVCCPPDKVELFTQLYGGPRVSFQGLDMQPIIRKSWHKKLYRLAFLLENSQYVKDQRLERYWNNKNIFGYLNYIWVSSLSLILSRVKFLHAFYRMFDYYCSDRRTLKSYFDIYNPDYLFASDAFGEIEIWFMKEARSRKIPIMAMVRSWDNTTTKGILRIIPDAVVVNSKSTKKELTDMHDVPENIITVAGLPQFDTWLSGPTQSREDFFELIGADLGKKLILFAPAGAVLSDTDWQLCDILSKALRENKFIEPVQFLVRNHPQHPANLEKFKKDPAFIIENPGHLTTAGDRKNVELRPEDNNHLRNSVYYSDVVMYIATSLGLDAAVFNKPQIIISFDGYEQRPYIKSVTRYNKEDCLANLVKLGGTMVARTPEELIQYINRYLSNSNLHNEERKAIVAEHMHIIDGHAGKRVYEFMQGFIKAHHS